MYITRPVLHRVLIEGSPVVWYPFPVQGPQVAYLLSVVPDSSSSAVSLSVSDDSALDPWSSFRCCYLWFFGKNNRKIIVIEAFMDSSPSTFVGLNAIFRTLAFSSRGKIRFPSRKPKEISQEEVPRENLSYQGAAFELLRQCPENIFFRDTFIHKDLAKPSFILRPSGLKSA